MNARRTSAPLAESQPPANPARERRSAARSLRPFRAAGLIAALALLASVAACQRPAHTATAEGGGKSAAGRFGEEKLQFAIDNVFRLNEFESAQSAMKELSAVLASGDNDVALKGENPLLASWPEPEMLRQIELRLDQWMREQQTPPEWQIDPAIATLPADLRALPMMQDLKVLGFSRYDGFCLVEAAWMRDLSSWICGDELNDVVNASRLFDWTIRDIQVELPQPFGSTGPADASGLSAATTPTATSSAAAEAARPTGPGGGPGEATGPKAEADPTDDGKSPAFGPTENAAAPAAPTTVDHAAFGGLGELAALPQVPWEVALFGNGSVTERAWLFILLARQKGIDAALLALADPAHPEALPQPWALAVLVNDQAYLFDPVLGLPIPGPEKMTFRPNAGLQIRPATLAQLAEDPSLLRRLDLNPERRYPVTAENLRHVVALVEASPPYLAANMRLIESHLSGERKLVLSEDATATMARWKKLPQIEDARLWQLPFDTLRRRLTLTNEEVKRRVVTLLPFYATPFSVSLRQGRMLYLKGQFVGQPGAISLWQEARSSNEELQQYHDSLLASLTQQLVAQMTEQTPPEKREAAKVQIEASARELATLQANTEVSAAILVKQDASYWLGLVAFELEKFPSAIDYFANRTLDAWTKPRWMRGAQYNLGRTYEAEGSRPLAIGVYRASPDNYGAQLRARWLSEVDVP